MSLVNFAYSKDAVNFQKALQEKIEATVDSVLADTKIELAGTLFGESDKNGIVSSAGGVKTREAGGKVGKDRLPDTTDIKSTSGNPPPGGTKLAHVETKPGTHLAVNPHMPGKTNEETEPKGRDESKGKRALRFAMKKKYDKKKVAESVDLAEKVITPGSVDHMAHAVHACASGHHNSHYRGSFTHYDHPDYAIHKDHGGISADKAAHHYYVVGHGGVHKFSADHTKNGVDVKHVGKIS